MGSNFPHVLLGSLGLLGEVDGESYLKATGDGHHLLADPGKGEIRDEVIGLMAGVHPHQILPHREHVVVGEQCPLG